MIRQRVTENLLLHGYMRIKADYGISIAAIIRRAKDLGVITAARYRSLSIQISSQGWRLNEPVEVGSGGAPSDGSSVDPGLRSTT